MVNQGVFYESRARLIKLGLIVPASIYLSLDKNSPARIEFEMKLIRSGIDPDMSKDKKAFLRVIV